MIQLMALMWNLVANKNELLESLITKTLLIYPKKCLVFSLSTLFFVFNNKKKSNIIAKSKGKIIYKR
jgi:hypothetical protein